jgi:hypothetical protein
VQFSVTGDDGRLDLEKARREIHHVVDLVMFNDVATTEQRLYELMQEVTYAAGLDARRDELAKWLET